MDPLKMTAADVEKLPEAQALEVIAAHVKAKQKDLPEALAASASKPLQRAAKKALYQLRSSGVAIEEPAAPAGPQPDVAPSASAELPGMISPILGTGETMLFFGKTARTGGVEFYQAILHDEFGVQQLDQLHTNRSRYRKQVKTIVKDRQVIEVPYARIVEELARAWGQNLRAKNGLPDAAYQNLHRLRVTPDETEPTLPPVEPGDAALAEKSASLHTEPELKQWLPSEEQLAAIGLEDHPEEKLGEKTEAFFTPEVLKLYARRLWKMAEFLEKTDRPEPAAIARAQARKMFHEPKSHGPFGRQLFDKVLALRPKK